MGIAAGDFSGDGRPDLLVSNSRGQGHAVFRSRGAAFANGQAAFATAFGTNFTGWGASWVDLNNDGNLDLVLANGAIPVTNLARDAGPVQVLENLDGEFANATALVGLGANAAHERSRDRRRRLRQRRPRGRGDQLRRRQARPAPRHRRRRGHWLEVKLPRFAPGAVVTAVLPDGRRLVHEVHAGSSYLSSEDPRVHFGLGSATKASVLTVRYPGGRTTVLKDVAADRIVTAR